MQDRIRFPGKGMGNCSKGFSLIEIVVVIVVMSIISIGIVQYIINSAAGYARTANRSELSAAGRVVIDRISMELHNALPNSVRIGAVHPTDNAIGFAGDQCIEFMPILAATTYIDPAIRPQPRTATFTVVDFVPDQDGASGKYISIYPRTSNIYNQTFVGPNTQADIAEASVADADTGDGINEITTTTNHRFRTSSPSMRAFLTDPPVSYCVQGDRLYKYSDYGFSSTQMKPLNLDGSTCAAGPGMCLPGTTPNRVLMTSFLDNAGITAFDQLNANRRRNSVVQIELNFNQDGDEVLLNHEVLLHSAP